MEPIRAASKDFGVRILPEGFILSDKVTAVFPADGIHPLLPVGLLNSRLINCLVNLQANAKQYDPGIVESIPLARIDDNNPISIIRAVENAVRTKWALNATDEVDALFSGLPVGSSLSDVTSKMQHLRDKALASEAFSIDAINHTVDLSTRLTPHCYPSFWPAKAIQKK